MTSMTWSGPTTPAVSSSTPRPSRLGFWAMRREQPAEPVPLLEMLVDDDARQDAEAGRDLGHPLLGRRAAGPEGDHVAAHRGGAGGRPGDHRPGRVALR